MCCFTGPVEHVSATSIFGRLERDGRQSLAYQMKLSASEEVAMVLPIPTPLYAPEDAVEFISLEGCPTLFQDLFDLFGPAEFSAGVVLAAPAAASNALAVEQVGAYEASFVPSIDEFGRLDPRFRMDPAVWDQLRAYQSWGFAVFQLQPAHGKEQHPMAFRFPSRLKNKLFFPTVHVHDGQVHQLADFDHYLYAQRLREMSTAWSGAEGGGWTVHESPIELPPEMRAGLTTPDSESGEGEEGAGFGAMTVRRHFQAQLIRGSMPEYINLADTAGLVDPTVPLHRLRLSGEFANADVVIPAA